MFLTVTMLGWGGRIDGAGAVRLAERGWEIGSHTMTHPVLTNVDDATLQQELAESKGALEQLTGTPCTAIAYPTGKCRRTRRRGRRGCWLRGRGRARGRHLGAAGPARVAEGRRAWRRQPPRVPAEVLALGSPRPLLVATGPDRKGHFRGRPRGQALAPADEHRLIRVEPVTPA